MAFQLNIVEEKELQIIPKKQPMKECFKVTGPITFIALLTALILSSCSACEDRPVISYFAFEQLSSKVVGEIDQTNRTINIEVPESVDVTNLTPTIELGGSDCLSLSPGNQIVQDFSQPVTYEVYNEVDEVTEYQVKVTVIPDNDPDNPPYEISWSSGNDMPMATAWSSAAVLNNLFYVCGGVDEEGNILNQVQIYNPSNDTWSLASGSMEAYRWGHSATTVDGKIYVMGGANVGQGPANKDIEQYDPVSGTWSIVGEMTEGRIGHGAVEYQGKIYIMGGEYEEPSLTTLRTVEVYDPSGNTWESLTPMPMARIFMGACVVDGVIYVLGGGSKYPYSGIKSVEAYDIAEDQWEEMTPLKTGLGDLHASILDGKIICAGGYPMWNTDATKTVQVYDPETDQSYHMSDMQFAHSAQAMLSFENKLYVMGGVDLMQPEFKPSSEVEIGILQKAGK